MATQSNQSEVCDKSPLTPKRGHLFNVDRDDKRFKICSWCGKTVYRTDQELLEGKM
jgi:hypothetical protein